MPQTPPLSERRLRSTLTSKACDSCKARKIRCSGYPPPCQSCSIRGATCRFGTRKIPLRKNVNRNLLLITTEASPSIKVNEVSPAVQKLPDLKQDIVYQPIQNDLFVDRILFGSSSTDVPNADERFSLKGIGLLSGTHSVTFFSDSRLETLSAKLQNNKVNDLIRRMSSVINNRAKVTSSTSPEHLPELCLPSLDPAYASKCITTYYEQVHPLFPHLDRETFDSTIASPNLSTILLNDPAFSALYHSVLALGSLHDGGGSFEPGKGKAWELLSVALARVPNLPRAKNSLVALQAITTVAVYCLGVPCISIEHKIMTEMARMAQDLAPVLCKGPGAKTFYRVFWVVYVIEKIMSFHFGRPSAIIDANIIVPMPYIPESHLGALNWTTILAQQARLLSRAMNTLFCPGVCHRGSQYFLMTIDQLLEDLEQWRASIADEFRPGYPSQFNLLRRPLHGTVGIWINYLYYSLKLILLRSRLQIDSCQGSELSKTSHSDPLIEVSRSVLEIVTYVDVEPSTPLWIIAAIPLCALFVLFDHVISHPKSPDTRSNLALLNIAGGHFSRIEFASGGTLPGSLISEFTYIAREYINQCDNLESLKGGQSMLHTENHDTSLDESCTSGANPGTSQSLEQDFEMAQATVLNSTSLMDPIYAPIETLWDGGSDPLYGIDVMNLFNSIM
ncbi:uncharacterized protein BKA55DRAFT_697668 [Fusarium redolens]|uniref:Zn(2)-C6 fungal-type domain-containing protein n=1 Tax=Fusarium redolens TaxID=48865 RepID=A0A9P9FXP5_FUSRE|nr:uncharacterized protein BKA55DRAFT_697668 [Fusarium redolens]KAH7216959.1 hypothetical protein BKA55DRAFT_697668 [Fusarium redolens]